MSAYLISLGAGILIGVQQVLIGLALGFAVRVVFAAVEFAGELIGLQMGLNFAGFFDPATGGQTTAVSRFFGVTVSWLFIVTGDTRQAEVFRRIWRIREGLAPRPADYDSVYWDLVLPGREAAGLGAVGGGADEFALVARFAIGHHEGIDRHPAACGRDDGDIGDGDRAGPRL